MRAVVDSDTQSVTNPPPSHAVSPIGQRSELSLRVDPSGEGGGWMHRPERFKDMLGDEFELL